MENRIKGILEAMQKAKGEKTGCGDGVKLNVGAVTLTPDDKKKATEFVDKMCDLCKEYNENQKVPGVALSVALRELSEFIMHKFVQDELLPKVCATCDKKAECEKAKGDKNG